MWIKGTAEGEATKRRARSVASHMRPAEVAASVGLDLETYWLLCMINGSSMVDTAAAAEQLDRPVPLIEEQARRLIARGLVVEAGKDPAPGPEAPVPPVLTGTAETTVKSAT